VRGNTRIAYSTRKADEGYLKKWIEPRWGEYRLLEIRAVEVESWLKSLDRAPGTRCKIRNVMSLLFNHGRRHDLCDRNPIQCVRQSAKRRTAPDILTSNEVQGLLANLRFRERTLVLLAVTTGLRRSEIFALKCKDVDFHAKQICVTRSIVQNVVGVCKTESSQKPVPAHDDLLQVLLEWHRQTPYQSPESWVFASPVNQGRWPSLAQEIMRHHIRPVARKLAIAKRIGWHTFRHYAESWNMPDLLVVAHSHAQAWLEFDVDSVEKATAELESQGYQMLVKSKKEPRGQGARAGPDCESFHWTGRTVGRNHFHSLDARRKIARCTQNK
jgi:integrase